jgi:hypothetical protein
MITLTQHLRDEHKALRGLLAQAGTVDQRAKEMEAGVVLELLAQLEIHTLIEDEFFYPLFFGSRDAAIRSAGEGSAADLRVLRQEASWISKELPDAEAFSDLVDSVEAHLLSTETDLFPVAEARFDPRLLRELGEKAIERRRQLMSAPQFRDALPEKVQNPSGGEQKRKIA